MQKLSKKTTRELSKLFNSCSVYTTMAKDAIREENYDLGERAMVWHNEAANELAKYGISVVKFNVGNQ